jgi:hypothetical protein
MALLISERAKGVKTKDGIKLIHLKVLLAESFKTNKNTAVEKWSDNPP